MYARVFLWKLRKVEQVNMAMPQAFALTDPMFGSWRLTSVSSYKIIP